MGKSDTEAACYDAAARHCVEQTSIQRLARRTVSRGGRGRKAAAGSRGRSTPIRRGWRRLRDFARSIFPGGGVAANSLGMPDLGISTMEDVLTDVRRITDVATLPLLVDIDTGWGGAFNIARTIRAMIRRVQARSYGRPGGREAMRASAGERAGACGGDGGSHQGGGGCAHG